MRTVPFAAAAALAAASTPAVAQTEAEAAAPPAAGRAAELSTGLDYQQGDFFTGEQVEIASVRNQLRVRSGRAIFAVSLPWHRIEAPDDVVGGGGLLGLPIFRDPGRPAARDVREGVGDLRVGAGYTVPAPGGVELTLNGEVKLPTASAGRGIGTGETDLALAAEAARSFGAVTPFVSIGYTMPGEPDAYELRPSLSARGGVALRLSPGLRGNVSYGYVQSPVSLVPDERQVSTRLDASLSRRLSLGLYGNAGLSDGAADVGAGLSLGFRIF
jgi:opacity protein-like surface antigen